MSRKEIKGLIVTIVIALAFMSVMWIGLDKIWPPASTATLEQKIQQEIRRPQEELIDQISISRESVVHVMCPRWQGSGFVVAPDLIVTARHVVDNVEDFVISTQNGHRLHATRAISDKTHDVGFIFIDDLTCTAEFDNHNFAGKSILTPEHKVNLKPVPLGSIKDCKLGDKVYVIGSPYGKVLNFNTVTTGIISGKDRDWGSLGDEYGWQVAFTVDSAGHPGNSGCPVFSEDGVVRGILVGGFSPVLIDVMPCDLFLSNLAEIRLMFIQDRFEREKEVVVTQDPYYNYDGDNEYYATSER